MTDIRNIKNRHGKHIIILLYGNNKLFTFNSTPVPQLNKIFSYVIFQSPPFSTTNNNTM